MGGCCLWLELDNLLLLWAHQPAFSAWLSRCFVGDAHRASGWGDCNRRHRCRAPFAGATRQRQDAELPAWTAGRIEQKAGQASRPKWRSGLQREKDRWMSFVVVRVKRSFSQSKRGLREASGGLGLRPLSNQGKSPLHWSVRGFRPCRKMSSIF